MEAVISILILFTATVLLSNSSSELPAEDQESESIRLELLRNKLMDKER